MTIAEHELIRHEAWREDVEKRKAANILSVLRRVLLSSRPGLRLWPFFEERHYVHLLAVRFVVGCTCCLWFLYLADATHRKVTVNNRLTNTEFFCSVLMFILNINFILH